MKGKKLMKEELSRLALIAGEEKVEKIQNAKIAIFGLGGVGGAALEALVRSGVNNFVLVDNDTVAKSNINRQVIAFTDNIGQKKTQAAKASRIFSSANAQNQKTA